MPRERVTVKLEGLMNTVSYNCESLYMPAGHANTQTGQSTDKETKHTLQVSVDSSFVLPSRCTVTFFQPQQIHNKQQEWQLHVPAVSAKEK